MTPPAPQKRHVQTREGTIRLHTPEEFASMRRAGRLASQVLDYITPFVKPGQTTEELNNLCHDFIVRNQATPAPLNYKGFPKSICTSLNHVVCHGIPGPKMLTEGDILNIDITVILDGWHGDTSRMFCVGKVSPQKMKLVQVTHDVMMGAIELIKPGVTLGDLGNFMESEAKAHGFSVVREYCGHGIGEVFHAPPSVVNFGRKGAGIPLQAGMFFTVEPMLNMGRAPTKLLKDGWTVVTADKMPSAQWEHTIGVTEDGYEIFTQS